jgi:putative endonuclease
MYYVYVLESKKDKKFYTGLTWNIEKRLQEHNSGISKTTKGRRPLKLVYYECCLNRKDAMRREKYLKTTWGKRYIRNRIRCYLEGEEIST